jgi:hypothetical protein
VIIKMMLLPTKIAALDGSLPAQSKGLPDMEKLKEEVYNLV